MPIPGQRRLDHVGSSVPELLSYSGGTAWDRDHPRAEVGS